MLRLVKGANMEMERIEAAIGGWPQAPFATKPETDANFKRMLRLTHSIGLRRGPVHPDFSIRFFQ